MTPKEKAEQIVDKYLELLPSRNPIMYIGDIETAQKCALISVDERIDEMYAWMGGGGYEWEKKRFQYWEQVKNEIEKL
jgi:hypothetical protein